MGWGCGESVRVGMVVVRYRVACEVVVFIGDVSSVDLAH